MANSSSYNLEDLPCGKKSQRKQEEAIVSQGKMEKSVEAIL